MPIKASSKKPKKKVKKVNRRKRAKPLQTQTQKQIVNINFNNEKKKKKVNRRKPKATFGKGTKPLQTELGQLKASVQSLGSNLNMFSSDTQRLNNLENLITQLRREKETPITTGRPTPQMINQTTQINRVYKPNIPEPDILIPRVPDEVIIPPTITEQLNQQIEDQQDFLQLRNTPLSTPYNEPSVSSIGASSIGAYSPFSSEAGSSEAVSSLSSGGSRSIIDDEPLIPTESYYPTLQNLLDMTEEREEENPYLSPIQQKAEAIRKRLEKEEERAEQVEQTQAEQTRAEQTEPTRKIRKDKGIKRGKNITTIRNEKADEFAKRKAQQRGFKNVMKVLSAI
tara:strand:- start:2067 stop:3086 length:1020 start_codon:yes stop_codon:yes gene_type:complete